MEEMIDVLDENGVKTGEVLSRKEVHKRGLWHRVVTIAIIDENNQILMQQRSYKKDTDAGKWDISAARTYFKWTIVLRSSYKRNL